ncbi:Serine carboxypeptidase-like 48 [Camellia lanceoleosa]|uniref:Serine carboxypeptidase-like 48 n=1 Tax=Camellia lanceoleosa TaxID=1840588 RepID=A0ACC0IIW0_9ERIC|nr:Serine carboxypeptidase-like 48 [Camellia lanceoleosa]
MCFNWAGNSKWVHEMEWSSQKDFTAAPTVRFLVDGAETGLLKNHGPLTFLKVSLSLSLSLSLCLCVCVCVCVSLSLSLSLSCKLFNFGTFFQHFLTLAPKKFVFATLILNNRFIMLVTWFQWINQKLH